MRLLHPLAEELPFGARNLQQLGGQLLAGPGLGGLVKIPGSARSLLRDGRPCSEREFLSTDLVQPLEPEHTLPLLWVGSDELLELADLLTGQPPLTVINVAAGPDVLVQHEAAEGGFGPGDACIHRASQEVHVVGVALAVEGLVALVVRHRDQDYHREQDEGRDERAGCGTAAPPVELQLLPAGRHDAVQSRPVNECGKADFSLKCSRLLGPPQQTFRVSPRPVRYCARRKASNGVESSRQALPEGGRD